MFNAYDPSHWRGREDGDDAGDTRRIHQVVRGFNPAVPQGTALIGFQCDEGVRRNGGRTGAAGAPIAIRSVLASMAWHAGDEIVTDVGDIMCIGDGLEAAQCELEERVKAVILSRNLPIVIGGGHEVAYGTGGGVLAAHSRGSRIGMINIDAHLDLRRSDTRNSGTSFADLAQRSATEGREFHYLCIGVARNANTGALFARAESLHTQWVFDEQVRRERRAVDDIITTFIDKCDKVYLSIDMDVLPAHEAPGVSAPAALGISFEAVVDFTRAIAASDKLVAVDIAEVNPVFDLDNRTARQAAYLLYALLHRRRV